MKILISKENNKDEIVRDVLSFNCTSEGFVDIITNIGEHITLWPAEFTEIQVIDSQSGVKIVFND